MKLFCSIYISFKTQRDQDWCQPASYPKYNQAT